MKKWPQVAMAVLGLTMATACIDAPDDSADELLIDEGVDAETRPVSLEGALPADGATVQGEFFVAAVVDGSDAEVRFFLDGTEVAVINEHPYQARIDGCELSVGNHFYVVEVRSEEGVAQSVEQWFTVEACP